MFSVFCGVKPCSAALLIESPQTKNNVMGGTMCHTCLCTRTT